MSGPSGVCNAGMVVKDLGEVRLLSLDQLLELRNLADLLEREHLFLVVAVDGETCRIVASVF